MPDTRNLSDAEALAPLPPRAVVANAARGGVVDEDAPMAALASGRFFATGLDVFATETRNTMGFRASDDIAAVLAGKPATDPLWS